MLSTRVRWVLAISILVNCFLLAFVGSRWLQRREHGAHGEPHGPGVFRSLIDTPELRTQHHAMMDARHAVSDALSAEPYDRAKLQHALATLRATTAKSQELLHQRMLEQAGQLTPAQRHDLASSRFLRGPDLGGAKERRGQ